MGRKARGRGGGSSLEGGGGKAGGFGRDLRHYRKDRREEKGRKDDGF